MKNYRDESRKQWGAKDENDDLNREQIGLGCLLRIADAVEKMAVNYVQMENSLKYFKEKADRYETRILKLERSNAALRGHVKRVNKKIKKVD